MLRADNIWGTEGRHPKSLVVAYLCNDPGGADDMALSELKFAILNAMMDDYEDLEQIYLTINRDALKSKGQPDHLLVTIADEILALLDAGLIEPRSSWKEDVAPISKLNRTAIHCYWFFPTEKGKNEWKNHATSRLRPCVP
jgi:hypothetical protein